MLAHSGFLLMRKWSSNNKSAQNSFICDLFIVFNLSDVIRFNMVWFKKQPYHTYFIMIQIS